jgi:ribose transport system ATP-binding protein
MSAVGLVDVRGQRAEIAELLEELAIPRALLSTMTSDMSTIEQELIEIARALRLGSQVLVLDEPTAPLGREEITRLFGVLKRIATRGAGIVIITHHLAEVFAVSDTVTCLREGQVVLQTSTKDINMAGLISAMLGRRPWEGAHLPVHSSKRVDAAPRSSSGQELEPSLKVRNLKVGTKLVDVSFEACPGEVLGVVGLAGSGRTTLLRTLFGDIRQGGGEILFRGKRYRPNSTKDAMDEGVFLIPEDRGVHGLMLAKSIAENITVVILRRLSGLLGLVRFSEARAQARKMMKVLDVRATGIDQALRELSGGNQQKVVLAKALTLTPDLLLLDEPTFGVDIGASHEIISKVRVMADEGATILWVSSDLLEVTHVADRIIVLRDGVVGATIGPEEADKFTEDALVAMMQRRQFEGTAAAAEVSHVGG